jgi:hypothetical protein
LKNIWLPVNFHEDPLCVLKLDASSCKAGKDSGNNKEIDIWPL